MKIKTNTLTGADLNRAVALALGLNVKHYRTWLQNENPYWKVRDCSFADPAEYRIMASPDDGHTSLNIPNYCGDWAVAGPLIEEHGISLVRCDDGVHVDADGWATSERIPVWAATHGQRRADSIYSSQGDNWGCAYTIDEENAEHSSSALVAAMRALVISKLGFEVELP